MIAAILWAALALDLLFLGVAAAGNGFSWTAGPFRIRLHDPSHPVFLALLLAVALLALAWRRPRRRAWALTAIVAVVGIGGAAIVRQASQFFPLADIAVIEIYVRDALTGHLLVGPYSRFGWHHPGPAYFYLAAPFYALGGAQPAALAAGAAAIALAAIALIVWTSARSFGSAITLMLAASVVAFVWRVPDILTAPWNPHVAILPTVALLVSGAALAGGDSASLPVALVLASFVVQTDIPLVPVSLAIAATSVGIWASSRVTEKERLKARAAWAVSFWALALVWLMPAAEEITRTPGNATLLWRFFIGTQQSGQAFGSVLPAWAAMLTAPIRPGLHLPGGGSFVVESPVATVVLAVAELVLLTFVGFRAFQTREQPLVSLAFVGVLASLVGLWSITRVVDRLMDHEVFWVAAVGLFNIAVIGAAGLRTILARLPAARELAPFTVPIVGGLLLGACGLMAVHQLQLARGGHLPAAATSSVVERLSLSVRGYIRDHASPKPLVRIGDDGWGLTAGVLLELDRAGVPFAVEESWMPMFPQAFAPDGTENVEISFSNADGHLKVMNRPGSVAIDDGIGTYIDANRLK